MPGMFWRFTVFSSGLLGAHGFLPGGFLTLGVPVTCLNSVAFFPIHNVKRHASRDKNPVHGILTGIAYGSFRISRASAHSSRNTRPLVRIGDLDYFFLASKTDKIW